MGEQRLADRGLSEGIGQSEQDEEDRRDDHCASEIEEQHRELSKEAEGEWISVQVQRGQDEVDQLDADERHDQTAHAVDQHIAAQNRGSA
jgi:hypothetical protein